MIESRYKIEYVLPDEDVKKSSPFRVLWYLLLIPLVLVAVTAITYDFSLKNIAQDSSVLLEKAKVAIFNLEDRKQSKNPELVSNQLVEKILIPKPKPIVKTKPEIIKTKPVVANTPDNTKEKKIISELTAKQERQLKEIQEQVEKNKELALSLNSLSSELILEKTRNDSLNSKLSEQEKDRLELEEQYNNALAEFERNKKSIESTVEQNVKIEIEPKTVKPVAKTEPDPKQIEPVKVVIESIPKEKELVKTEVSSEIKENPELEKTETSVSSKSKEKKEEKELSSTDKIIATMSSADSEKPQEEIAKQEKSELTEESENKEVVKAQEVSNETPKKEKNIVFALGVQNSEEIKIDNSLTTSSIIETQEKEVADIDNKKETNTAVVIKESVTIENKPETVKSDTKIASKDNPAVDDAPKVSSPVDKIIAAMQQSQLSNSPKLNQNVDPNLEKDIKQQLVEQGDLSIDN